MKFKLTQRDQGGLDFHSAALDALGQRMDKLADEIRNYAKKNTDEAALMVRSLSSTDTDAVWQAAHDAAPDDATKALMELVSELRVYRRAREQRNIELGAQRIERVMNALDRLRATPEGAALIRQAEEQSYDR